jgi:Flp pilus assembly protein TadD
VETRATRPTHFLAATVVCLACAAAPAASAQSSSPLARASRAVVAVVVHDGAGAAVARGSGVFLDIGKLAVPRPLLAMGTDLGVVVGGHECRTTAVLAEDREAGVALVAVDLPDGAPPAVAIELRPSATSTVVQALGAGGGAREVPLGVPSVVPGLGAVSTLPDGRGVEVGSAVVNSRGELVGMVAALDAEPGATAAFVVPSARLLAMSRVGPVPLLEWALRARAERTLAGARSYARGATAALSGRVDEAAAAFDEAATASPADTEAWCALAACRRAQHDADGSIAAWTRAAAAQPANAKFRHELAVDLSDSGRHDQAVAAFTEVVKLRPADPAAQFNLGVALAQVGRYEEEYQAYQAALALDPSHVGALRNLGVSCLTLKRNDEAVSTFARASRLAPADPEVETGLGLSFLSLRRYREAIDALRHALQLAPGFVKARFSLGIAYFSSGDKTSARSECQALRAVDRQKGEQLCRIVDAR